MPPSTPQPPPPSGPGPEAWTSIELQADAASLPAILAFIDGACAHAGIQGSTRHDLRLAVEEVCSNILRHGYGQGSSGPVRLALRETADHYEIRIEDEAPLFDPTAAPEPDLASGWKKRRIGGLGWHLVRRMVDELRHEPVGPTGNRIILVKTKPHVGGT